MMKGFWHKFIVICSIFINTAIANTLLETESTKPNIVFILVDDFGYNNIGFHAKDQKNQQEVKTPNMDHLAQDGIILERHYVFKYCSPSRSALQTGRNPIHVNVLNDPLGRFNESDPISGFSGIPRNMTGIAEKLKSAGYSTIMSGKWHAGLATMDHTPYGRGYDESLCYLSGANDYWTSQSIPAKNSGSEGFCTDEKDKKTIFTDLWRNDRPAWGMNNSQECSQEYQPSSCLYEDEIFADFVIKQIQAHNTKGNNSSKKPFFLYYAPHSIHGPLEVPQEQLDKFSFIDDEDRRKYAAMVNYIDGKIGEVIKAIKDKGMYDNTLIVLSSDNGGPIYANGKRGGNNYPLRGGKMSNFEGGVRSNAFISGGYLPQERRGIILGDEALIGIEDWYATFCKLAGVDPHDDKAEKAGLPPIDSIDQSDYLLGKTDNPPREEIILGDYIPDEGQPNVGRTYVQGLINNKGKKLLIGNVQQNIWQGPFYPNITTKWQDEPLDCISENPCLFDVFSDPTEHQNIAKENPEIIQDMLSRLKELTETSFSPYRGTSKSVSCKVAKSLWKGFIGPFLE